MNPYIFIQTRILEVKKYVLQAFTQVSILIAVKYKEKYVGFMGINAYRNQEIGKDLMLYGIKQYDVNEVCVNEHNSQAVGFEMYSRSEWDEQHKLYPILYMRRK